MPISFLTLTKLNMTDVVIKVLCSKPHGLTHGKHCIERFGRSLAKGLSRLRLIFHTLDSAKGRNISGQRLYGRINGFCKLNIYPLFNVLTIKQPFEKPSDYSENKACKHKYTLILKKEQGKAD